MFSLVVIAPNLIPGGQRPLRRSVAGTRWQTAEQMVATWIRIQQTNQRVKEHSPLPYGFHSRANRGEAHQGAQWCV